MIIDHISNARFYDNLGPGIEVALRYLAAADFRAMEPGRYELDLGCFALVQQYETLPREEKRWEAHQKYIDVQFVAAGMELMGYTPRAALRVIEDYDQTKDIEWFEGEGSFIEAGAGTFVILFPHDAHMPGVAAGKPGPVRKVVVKVPAI